jgi:hypothetical protein
MPSWNIDICKGNKGNTKNRGQIYSFEIIEIVSETVLIEQPIPRYKNVVRYDDTPQTQNTKVVNSEKVIGFTTGYLQDKSVNYEIYGSNVVGQGKITHVAQVERNPVNITSYNIVKVIDSIYGSERKFQVVTAGVNEKDTTKISLRLRLLENKA